MEAILDFLESILPDSIDAAYFLKMSLILTVGSLILGFIGRFAFGKKSTLNQSVSSAIGILFIYAVTVVIHSYALDLSFLVSPLPFVQIHGETMTFFNFQGVDYTIICGEVLNMIILAFLANLVNTWLPKGKHLLTWLLFRVLSVALGMIAFSLVNNLLTTFLPEGLITWAPVILLGLLALMLLLGALKGVVGALLASANPLLGFLYTFFFSTLVGKMLSKAMLTTVILSGLVYALNHFGVAAIAIGTAALLAYLPLLIILLVLWYVIGKLL